MTSGDGRGRTRGADLPSVEGMTKRPAPLWLRILLPILLLPVAGLSVLLPASIPGVAAAMDRPDGLGVAAYALAASVPLLVYVLGTVLLVRGLDHRPLRAVGIRPRPGALLLGILVSVLAMGAAVLAGRLTSIPAPDAAQPAAVPFLVALAFVLLRAFVLQGIGEELLFRGYLLQTLSRRPRLAVLITAVAFTIPHLASSGGQQDVGEQLLYLAMPFGFALSAGMLAIALRSVWAGIGIHGGFHLANALAGALGIPLDGPAAWLLLGAAHTLAAIIIAGTIRRRRWLEVSEHGPYAP